MVGRKKPWAKPIWDRPCRGIESRRRLWEVRFTQCTVLCLYMLPYGYSTSRQTWPPKDDSVCHNYNQGAVETRLHSLIECNGSWNSKHSELMKIRADVFWTTFYNVSMPKGLGYIACKSYNILLKYSCHVEYWILHTETGTIENVCAYKWRHCHICCPYQKVWRPSSFFCISQTDQTPVDHILLISLALRHNKDSIKLSWISSK